MAALTLEEEGDLALALAWLLPRFIRARLWYDIGK
jgi:hypothetical protein